MSQISITINNKLYHIACDEGQEAHLIRLGNYMNQRAKELTSSIGGVEESLLLVMIGLLIADELSEAYNEIDNTKNNKGSNKEEKITETIDQLTNKIQSITKKLKLNQPKL